MVNKICGVYKITNTVNGKFYVGSSKDIKGRWYQHKKKLREGIHGNLHLQNAWNLYGEDSFKFEIVEECDSAMQFEREQYYLDSLNPFDDNGYNIVRQISKEYMSDNYMIKICERCENEYHTFSHLSKYCDKCKEIIKQENKWRYETDKYWMTGTSAVYEAMYDGYGSADYFWECNF